MPFLHQSCLSRLQILSVFYPSWSIPNQPTSPQDSAPEQPRTSANPDSIEEQLTAAQLNQLDNLLSPDMLTACSQPHLSQRSITKTVIQYIAVPAEYERHRPVLHSSQNSQSSRFRLQLKHVTYTAIAMMVGSTGFLALRTS